MRLNRSTFKTISRTIWAKRKSLFCGFLVVFITLAPLTGTADTVPVIINLLEHNTPDSPAEKATLYLKVLIEQRTNNRLRVTIHKVSPVNVSAIESSTVFQMAALDSFDSLKADEKLAFSKLEPVEKVKLDSYHLLANGRFLSNLSDELNIILQGAIKDTLVYLEELEKK